MTRLFTRKASAAFIAAILAVLTFLSACGGNANTPSGSDSTAQPSAGGNSQTATPEVSSEGAEDITAQSTTVQAEDIAVIAEPGVELIDLDFGWSSKSGLEYRYIFSDGLMPAAAYLPELDKTERYYNHGFIDASGAFAIDPQFEDCSPFREGRAAVKAKVATGENSWDYHISWGYIDTAGNIVIALEYAYANPFSEGLAAVCDQDEKWGFIDTSGNVVIPFQFEYYNGLYNKGAEGFSEGLAYVFDGEMFGYIDKTGKVIIPFEYDYAQSFNEGLALVKKDGIYGYIDKNGDVAIPFTFQEDEYLMFGQFHEGLASFYSSVGYGFIDTTGQVAIEPLSTNFYTAGFEPRFSEGYVLLPRGGNQAIYMDRDGKVLRIPGGAYLQGSTGFEGGVAIARMEKSYILINTDGEMIAEHAVIVGLGEGLALFSDTAPENTDAYKSGYGNFYTSFGVLQNNAYQAPGE